MFEGPYSDWDGYLPALCLIDDWDEWWPPSGGVIELNRVHATAQHNSSFPLRPLFDDRSWWTNV